MNVRQFRFNAPGLVCASVLTLGCGLGAAGVAQADEAARITVSYADLNLAQPADARVLYRRLQRAAAGVCALSPARIELSRYAIWERCYNEALHRAVLQVDAPELLANYAGDPTRERYPG